MRAGTGVLDERRPRAQGGNESEDPPMTEEQKRKRDEGGGASQTPTEQGPVTPVPEEAAGE
jgi:hypothetical protein